MADALNLDKFLRVPWCTPQLTITPDVARELQLLVRHIGGSLGLITVPAERVIFVPSGGFDPDTTDAQLALTELDTRKQEKDATLTALAGAATAADRLIYWTGIDVAAVAVFTAAGRALVDDADAAAQRATLGLGTLATQSGTFTDKLDVTAAPELIRDTMGTALVAGSNITLTVDDAGDTITIAAALNAAGVGLGSVTNDAQTKAAIVPNTVPAAGQVLVGNAGGTAYAPVAMSGDATLASTGALTLSGRRQLASVTLGSAGTTLSSGAITAKRHLEVHIFVPAQAGSDCPSLTFNGTTLGTGVTSYRYKWTFQAAAATLWTAGNTAVSTELIKIGAASTARTRRTVAFISNDSATTEKLVLFTSVMGTNSAATQTQIDQGNGAWFSAAATQITQIDLVSTSNMNAGTQMTVYGWD